MARKVLQTPTILIRATRTTKGFSTTQTFTVRNFEVSKENRLHIRRATLGDKDGVLRILGTRGEPDCLPCYYDNIVSHPNSKTFIAVSGGLIVSFASFYVVDEGRSVIIRHARTLQSFRGQHLQKQLMEAVGKTNLSGKPFRATILSNSVFLQKPRTSIISWKPMLLFHFKPDDLKTRCPSRNAELVSDRDIEALLTDNAYKRYLFPNDLITIDWVPFALLPSNIPLMKGIGGFASMISDVTLNNDKPRGLFSASSWFPFNGVIYCCIDVYGTDLASLHCHIEHHVMNNKPTSTASLISLLVVFEPEVKPSIAEAIFWRMGLVRSIWKDKSTNEEILYQLVANYGQV